MDEETEETKRKQETEGKGRIYNYSTTQIYPLPAFTLSTSVITKSQPPFGGFFFCFIFLRHTLFCWVGWGGEEWSGVGWGGVGCDTTSPSKNFKVLGPRYGVDTKISF